MPTSRAVASSSLLFLAITAALRAEEEPREKADEKTKETVLAVPRGEAPELDGLVGEEEWKGARAFQVARGGSGFGLCRIRRVGRDLYLAFQSKVHPYSVNLRLAFFDERTRSSMYVNVNPLNPPMPPLLLHRESADREVERAAAGASDLRMHFGEKGFSFELKLPLDELEFERSRRDYLFSVQMWHMERQRCVAWYPPVANPNLITPGYIRLRPEGDWGTEIPLQREAPAPQPALKLLEDLWREQWWARSGGGGPPPAELVVPYEGRLDGKRQETPLKEVEKRLFEAWERYPEYATVAPQLVRVKAGRNDLEGALTVLQQLEERFPMLAGRPPLLNLKTRALRDLGRYEEAHALLVDHWQTLRYMPQADDFRRELEAQRDAWKLELGYREQDAARGDLPRVLLKTSKGDIVLELFEDDVPDAVANFVALVEQGYYDGIRFNWVEGGARVVGGDPNTRDDDPDNDGYGGPGYLIETEVGRRLHHPYTISYLDHERKRRSEASMFTIAIAPLPILDGINTVFGRVVRGEDVVRALEYYDWIVKATVVRKRDHPYVPRKR